MYYLWKAFSRLWEKEEYLCAAYTILHLIAGMYLLVIPVGMIYMHWIVLVPHSVSWGETPSEVKIVLGILSLIWLIGAVVRLCGYVRLYKVHGRLLEDAVPAPAWMQSAAAEAAQIVGIQRKVSVYLCENILTAELGTGLTPRIYLPDAEYTEQQVKIIIMHELTHYRYGDHLIRMLSVLMESVYWFHPAVRKLNGEVIHWDELHCDFCVCEKMGEQCTEYARTLYYMCEFYVSHKGNASEKEPALIGFEGEGKVEERVRKILQYHKNGLQRSKWAVWMLAVLYLAAGGVTALAAQDGVEHIYGEITDRYIVATEVEEAEMYLEIYTYTTDILIETDETALPQAASSGVISVTVSGNSDAETGYFRASKGDIVSLLVSCDPSNISINVGLKKSDKSVQYVYSSGDIYSSFEIASTGYYTVYFQNDTSAEVEITGYYSTASAE
ncbi:MAG: M56 family metallopeptidase [Lachnospiraceae bacterium]|nr:M56 family metallopeptidase [Lachnospiraceae bacterium]